VSQHPGFCLAVFGTYLTWAHTVLLCHYHSAEQSEVGFSAQIIYEITNYDSFCSIKRTAVLYGLSNLPITAKLH
jgi:hypothetical protein